MEYKRMFIEKKKEFNTKGKVLLNEFRDYLEVQNLTNVRLVNVYDLINGNERERDLIINEILFEEVLDNKYEDSITLKNNEKWFRVEYLKGQYNQREDSANQMARILTINEDIIVQNSMIIILENVSDEELNKIKKYYINPIEMKEVQIDSFQFEKEEEATKEVEILERFNTMIKDDLSILKNKYGIGMDMEDLQYCQEYFKNEEKRNPTITEIKVLDTYWSDHCRHTTFMTEITDITMDEGQHQELFQKALDKYIKSRNYVYESKERPICLMDLATINMKETKKKGLLNDKEESDEVNAASIEIDVDIDGKDEKWLLMFKNETHNHPTEMEPFGGAATCLGGAIRDPLSGRAFVYQAMRITGAADPRQKYEDTLPGKLPQRTITQRARDGYSSYGYGIGAATGFIKEIYHEGYMAKRMELGALVAATPKENVLREKAEPGDLIILVGGKTGRDGLGGAVGSSKEHTEESLHQSGAEVQKGNPAVERKIVRLFRNEEVSKMIKVCNDFGAGGVSVAIGELADGLIIDLDKVPLKYPGLDGSEIALSESQERMAVVIDKENLSRFMAFVEAEDIEGTIVATVSLEKSLKMIWRGNTIVDIKREFLDTNGIRKKTKINIEQPIGVSYLENNPSYIKGKNIKDDFIENIKDLNTSSQKGLIEGFDHTIGVSSVLLPLGGKYKLTPAEGMVAKIPVLKGNTNTCSLMSFGFDPKLLKWSPFHGGYYAVIESIAKIVAMGGDYKKVRLTFQEYFERLGDDPTKWGKPFSALLGAYLVQQALDTPSIGGKDSMSGTFEDINVPPTMVSFAVGTGKIDNIISPEFKEVGSTIALVKLDIDNNGMVDFEQLKSNYIMINKLIEDGAIISASTIKFGGIARSIAEMSMGNKIGFKFKDINKEDLFKPLYGSIIVELRKDTIGLVKQKEPSLVFVGSTVGDETIDLGGEIVELDSLIKSFEEPLEEVFPVVRYEKSTEIIEYNKDNSIKRNKTIAKPRVFIPIFTGTHGEYQMARAFEDAGGKVDTFIFKSLNLKDIENSYKEIAKLISEYQIIGLPNGALLGDEPETGGKLMKLIFSNPYIKEEINNHLNNRDGLILGIGAGLLGLIKLGLIDNNEITDLDKNSTFINHNRNGQFISRLADIKLCSNLSPWFNEMKVGDIYTAPLATKEGMIIGNNLDKLIDKGQIATQFANENPTGSLYGIESLTSPNGRVLGTISSIDRVGNGSYKNGELVATHKIFKSGIKYFGE